MNTQSINKLPRLLRIILLLGLVLAQSGRAVGVAHAAGIVVNSLADSAPANDGACTLREATINTNLNNQSGSTDCAAGSGVDTITFSVSGTIVLTSPLIITDPARLTIYGAGQSITLSGNDKVRVMEVRSGALLVVQNLTITNGRFHLGGGGIVNKGTLYVFNSTFSHNVSFGFEFGFGGAIWNDATLDVRNSTFSDNAASEGGGGIWNDGTLKVTNSTFSGNQAKSGGGIENRATLIVTQSTFSGNSATFSGGAIYTGGAPSVTNSTFSGNSAPVGGGIWNDGTLKVTNSTFSGNTATEANGGGGIWNFPGRMAILRNTIVAQSPSGRNCSGVITDGGGNLSYPADMSCPGINDNPLLGPLELNPPGTTKTHALMAGSPAINAAMPAHCPDTDQRGVSRPQGPGCDIGAYELEVPPAPTSTPTKLPTSTPTLKPTGTPTP